MWLRLLLFLILGYLLWRFVTRSMQAGGGGGSSRFQCGTCRHCKTEFDDGVICMFQGRETFKNEVHIANCNSHQRRTG